jgi:hypothetical protein
MQKNSPSQKPVHLVAVALALLLVCNESFGYVDPGAGPLLWQLALATVAGAILALRARFQSFFRRWRERA